MNVLAHTDDLDAVSKTWDWSSPVGLGVFIVSIAATLALLAWTISVLSKIDAQNKKR